MANSFAYETRAKHINDIIWQDTTYDLKTFLAKFKPYLPLIVRVTEGYLGPDELHTISGDEVYRLHAIRTQTRMLVRDRISKNTYSIPLDYFRKFCVKPRTTTKFAMSKYKAKFPQGKNHGFYLYEIKEVLSYPDPTVTLVFENHNSMSFYYGGDRADQAKIGELEPVALYEERYLLGNSVIGGVVYHKVATIPLYMSIMISIGVGVRPEIGGLDEWVLMQSIFDENSDKFNYESVTTNAEIMQFGEDEVQRGNEYEYLKPKEVIYDVLPASRVPPGAAGQPAPQSTKQPTTGPQSYVNVTLQHKKCNETKLVRPEGRKKLDRKRFPPPYADYDNVIQLKDAKVQERFQIQNAPVLPATLVTGPAPPLPPRERNTESIITDTIAGHVTSRPKQITAVPPTPRRGIPRVASREVMSPPTEVSSKSITDDAVNYEPVHPRALVPARRTSFRTLQEVPRDTSSLSVRQVVTMLSLLKLDRYSQGFVDQDVDGQLLQGLDEECLKQEFAMNAFEARKLLRFVKEGWRPNTD